MRAATCSPATSVRPFRPTPLPVTHARAPVLAAAWWSPQGRSNGPALDSTSPAPPEGHQPTQDQEASHAGGGIVPDASPRSPAHRGPSWPTQDEVVAQAALGWGGERRPEEDSGPNARFKSYYSALKARWDSIEDKPLALVSAAALAVVLYVSPSLVDAVDRFPQPIPKAFGFVGLLYSAWFTRRYVLFKAGRDEFRAIWSRKANELSSKATKVADSLPAAVSSATAPLPPPVEDEKRLEGVSEAGRDTEKGRSGGEGEELEAEEKEKLLASLPTKAQRDTVYNLSGGRGI